MKVSSSFGSVTVPRQRWLAAVIAALTLLSAAPAHAEPVVSCGGQALLGGALLLCSHVRPGKPTQSCSFRWALATPENEIQVVQGSFLMPPGATNVQVWQGAGFARAVSPPIVLCQGGRGE